jgi:hypothetical protein
VRQTDRQTGGSRRLNEGKKKRKRKKKKKKKQPSGQ